MAGEAGVLAPYTGPRPSPARAWAPWVIVVAAACAFGNAALCVLNLIERRYQQRRLTANPVSVARIRHMISLMHSISVALVFAFLAFLVVWISWSTKRRSRLRVSQDGETGVEPRMRDLQPTLYWTEWVLIGVSLLITLIARSLVHPQMTVQQIVTYRTYLAAGNATRLMLWSCLIASVVVATQAQDRREAFSRADAERSRVAGFSETTWSATRVCAVAMLAAGDRENAAARLAVVRAVRVRGLENYDDQWLEPDLGSISPTQIASYVAPLTQVMVAQEKELFVRQIAGVGLADGPLTLAETSVLEATAAALGLGPADLQRIMSSGTARPGAG